MWVSFEGCIDAFDLYASPREVQHFHCDATVTVSVWPKPDFFKNHVIYTV